jgi:hypothetical protein
MLNELDKELGETRTYVMFAMQTTLVFMQKVTMQPAKPGTSYLFLKEQAEIADQPGEKRHTQTCKLYNTWVWFCTHLCKRRERQISVGRKRKELEIAKAENQNHHKENYSILSMNASRS